jgi:hypothetical protein
MRLDRYTGVADFLAATGEFLAAREAEHNLMLGISSSLVAAPGRHDEPPYMGAVFDSDQVAMAALLRTPPFNLILSEVDDLSALELVADDLAGTVVPGVVGPPEATRRFADRWVSTEWWRLVRRRRRADLPAHREVTTPRPAPGSWRRRFADRALLAELADRLRHRGPSTRRHRCGWS